MVFFLTSPCKHLKSKGPLYIHPVLFLPFHVQLYLLAVLYHRTRSIACTQRQILCLYIFGQAPTTTMQFNVSFLLLIAATASAMHLGI